MCKPSWNWITATNALECDLLCPSGEGEGSIMLFWNTDQIFVCVHLILFIFPQILLTLHQIGHRVYCSRLVNWKRSQASNLEHWDLVDLSSLERQRECALVCSGVFLTQNDQVFGCPRCSAVIRQPLSTGCVWAFGDDCWKFCGGYMLVCFPESCCDHSKHCRMMRC